MIPKRYGNQTRCADHGVNVHLALENYALTGKIINHAVEEANKISAQGPRTRSIEPRKISPHRFRSTGGRCSGRNPRPSGGYDHQ